MKRFGISGTSLAGLKKNYSIIPTIFLCVFGMIGAGGYVTRLATRHPEVSWTRGNSEPWEEYYCKQYKFVSSGRDYTKPSLAPKYK